jgi:hypothetical protein
MLPRDNPRPLDVSEQGFAVTTWRYLRLAMVGLVIGLAVSLVYERTRVDCFQTSISAYYYTPVQAYFVGALVAIGVCLFSLKGNTEWEDALLNLAGMLAPIVALVPTPKIGDCKPYTGTTAHGDLNIANNVVALLAVEFLALAFVAAIRRRKPPSTAARIGYFAAVSVWVATTAVFALDRGLFDDWAHNAAAVLMFVCIIAVVLVNAVDYKESGEGKSLKNRYAAVAVVMVATLPVIVYGLRADWPYWTIVVEGSVIALFAIFWGIQTKELWNKGLRAAEAEPGSVRDASSQL